MSNSSRAQRGRFSWRTRAENPLNVWVFASIHPAILLAEFSVTNRERFQDQLIDMAFTWYGLLVSLLVFQVLRWSLRKVGLLRRAFWPVLIVFGAIVGISADLSTMLLEGAAIQAIFEGVPTNHIFALGVGGLLAVASALLETTRQDYEETRLAIIGEKVRQASENSGPRSPVLETFVTAAKSKLREASEASEVAEFASSLRSFVNDELRPMSHTLWEKEERQQRKFSLGLLVSRVLASPIRYPLAVALFAVIGAARSILARDPMLGWINLATLFAIVTLALYLFRLVHSKGWLPSPVRKFSLAISAGLAGLAAVPTPRLFVPYDERIVTFNYWLVASLIIGLAGFATTLIYQVRQLLDNQARELREVMNNPELSDDQAFELASIRARDAANYLHSTTQNQLLALAMRLEGIGGAKLGKEQLRELEEILDGALVAQSQHKDLPKAIAALADSWRGLVKLDFQNKLSSDLEPTVQEILFLAIREAVSNSYRHGGATAVVAELKEVSGGVRLEVVDNGKGLTRAKPGLGSRIFSMAGNWSLGNNSDGGVRLSITT